jgi:hypothetical protein
MLANIPLSNWNIAVYEHLLDEQKADILSHSAALAYICGLLIFKMNGIKNA